MSGNLTSLLVECIKQLQSDKIADRKKQAEILQNLIKKSEIVNLLDKNTDQRRKSESHLGEIKTQITWDIIFRTIQSYIVDEADRLQKRDPTGKKLSAVIVNNWNKEKLACSSLFKTVVKIANQRKPRLNIIRLINFIELALDDDFLCSVLGLDCTNILIKDILTTNQLFSEISFQSFQSLIQKYIKFIQQPPPGWDRCLLTQALYLLTEKALALYDLEPQIIFKFISSHFKNIRTEKTNTYLEGILLSLMKICYNFSLECRQQICHLGEEIMIPLLYLWNNKPSDNIKELLLEFFRLQVAIHHPCGVNKSEEGALACNWELWLDHLKKLYNTVNSELKIFSTKNKYSSSKELTMKPKFVVLAVEIYHQIFSLSEISIYMSQFETYSNYGGENATKKQCLEAGIQSFITSIQQLSATECVIPLLQLLTGLLTKYPQTMNSEDLINLLELLLQIQLSCKQLEIKQWLLNCCYAALMAYCYLKEKNIDVNEIDLENLQSISNQLWERTIKTVSLNHCHEESHRLLQLILLNKLVMPRNEFFHLFSGGSGNKPSKDSLQTLLIYFQNYSIPSQNPLSCWNHENIISDTGKYWFQHQILEWLFPVNDNHINEKFSFPSYLHHPDLIPLFSQLIIEISLLNNNKIRNMQKTTIHTDISDWKWIDNLEVDYLEMTFHKFAFTDISKESDDYKNNALILKKNQNKIICSVWKYVQEIIMKISSELLEQFTQSQSIELNVLLVEAYFIVEIFKKAFEYDIPLIEDIPSIEELTSIGLGKLAKNLIYTAIKKLLACFEDTGKFIDLYTPLNTLDCMLSMDTFKNMNKCSRKNMARWIVSIFPPKFITFLLNTINNKSFLVTRYQLKQNDQNTDDFNELPSTSMCFEKKNKTDDNIMEVNLLQESSEIDDEILLKRNIYHICIKLLFSWCDYAVLINDGIETNCTYEDISKNLLIMCEQNFKNKEWNAEMVLSILKYFLKRNYSLNVTELTIIINSLRNILNKHHKEEEISITSLNIIINLIPYVLLKDCSNELNELKQRIVYLIKVFWKKEIENKCNRNVSFVLLQSMAKLLECDPFEELILWSTDENEKQPLFNDFIKFLSNKFYKIRKFACISIKYIFNKNKQESKQSFQTVAFDKIYITTVSSLKVQDYCHDLSEIDENNGRSLTLLLCFSYIILSSPYCEKSAIFGLCQTLKEKNIAIDYIMKALIQVSKILKNDSVSEFMEFHLPYLISEWMKQKYKLEDFPYQLLQCQTLKKFYEKYYITLVSMLFYHHDMSTIQILCKEINQNWIDILTECLPQLLAQILPWFANATSKIIFNEDKQNLAYKSHSLLENILTNKILENVLERKLEEVIICLLNSVEETERYFEEIPSKKSTISITNPPSFPIKLLKATIHYLIKNCCTDKSQSLVGLLSQKHDGIQKILLFLHLNLSKMHRIHEKRRVLIMYDLFFELLLPELQDGLAGNSLFVIRDIIVNMMHFLDDQRSKVIEKETEELLLISLNLVKIICQQCFPVYKEVIAGQLSRIVYIIRFYVEFPSRIQENALCLLKLLLVENSKYLEKEITLLNPFPDKYVFDEIKNIQKSLIFKANLNTLDDEISHFIISYSNSEMNYTLEGLQHLLKQIISRKEELRKLISNLQERRHVMEDISSSVLHKLICILIQICNYGKSEIQKLAIECLGELGPIDLSTIILQPSAYFQEEEKISMITNFINAKTQYKCYFVIFNLLNDFLQDKRINVVSATSEVLKNILRTKSGREFLSFYKENKIGNNHYYFHPFFDEKMPVMKISTTQNGEFLSKISDESLWSPDDSSYEEWLTQLVINLLKANISEDEVIQQLEPICVIEVRFCEKILPFLIHMILLRRNDDIRDSISYQIKIFFVKHCNYTKVQNSSLAQQSSRNFKKVSSICLCKSSVQIMLNVVHHLRCNQKFDDPKATAWDNQFWLDVNYLHIAQAAHYCFAPFTSLLYTEIWFDSRMRMENSEANEFNFDGGSKNQSSPLMLAVSHSDPENAKFGHDLLREAYKHIGDVDGEYGCQSMDINTKSSEINYYIREKQWSKLLALQDIYLSESPDMSNINILEAMKKCGLFNIMKIYINNIIKKNTEPSEQLLEYQNECAWRLSQWDIPDINRPYTGFHHAIYKSLTSLLSKDQDSFEDYLNSGCQAIVKNFQQLNLESVRNIYPELCKLKMLNTLQDYSKILWRNSDLASIISKWHDEEKIPYSGFEFIEPVLWIQCTLLKQHVNNSFEIQAKENLVDFLHMYIQKAIKYGYYENGRRAVHILETLTVQNNQLYQWKIEDAKLHWIRNEYSIAKQKLKELLKSLEKCSGYVISVLKAKALMLSGQWLSETCSDNASNILKYYFEKAVDVLQSETFGECPILWDAFLSVARYSDLEYQRIVNYMNSSNYQAKQEVMQSSYLEIQKLKNLRNQLNDDEKRTLKIMMKQIQIDEEEINVLQKTKLEFLNKAVENYLKCLKGTNCHDLRIFQLTSLWFQNHRNDKLNAFMKNNIYHIQTYKFLPLMYQLAARMCKPQLDKIEFSSLLFELIQKIILDHPYHSLPVIFALQNADSDILDGTDGTNNQIANEERVEAAKQLITKLKNSRLMKLMSEMEIVLSAYIKLAYLNPSKGSLKLATVKIPREHPILKIKDFSLVSVLTEEIKINYNCKYEDIVGIKSFSSDYEICGGINVPKVISCIGTNGKKYKQLVKGRDDLRQDAVMQQVFNLVNCLLQNNSSTKKRKLKIRTYKVIPLSRRCGIIEWCEGTQPLSEYLVGGTNLEGGAHPKYFPENMTAKQCMKTMANVMTCSVEVKENTFKSICKKFYPVFRYFFLEHFPEPSLWFERRLTYTQSVATSSIVGYILGIGDRHVNNILIDIYTAEIIHIDFGIAFEKGRILGTPETVPFRLTRDIVDGMGIYGTEGIFKRCSEKTMEVLRNSQEILRTILEVFLYDPLYDWTISRKHTISFQHHQEKSDSNPVESCSLSCFKNYKNVQNCQEINKTAERALIRLQQKLQGMEDTIPMSISGQVNMLIQKAQDPRNLCQLYPGWQPYL